MAIKQFGVVSTTKKTVQNMEVKAEDFEWGEEAKEEIPEEVESNGWYELLILPQEEFVQKALYKKEARAQAEALKKAAEEEAATGIKRPVETLDKESIVSNLNSDTGEQLDTSARSGRVFLAEDEEAGYLRYKFEDRISMKRVLHLLVKPIKVDLKGNLVKWSALEQTYKTKTGEKVPIENVVMVATNGRFKLFSMIFRTDQYQMVTKKGKPIGQWRGARSVKHDTRDTMYGNKGIENLQHTPGWIQKKKGRFEVTGQEDDEVEWVKYPDKVLGTWVFMDGGIIERIHQTPANQEDLERLAQHYNKPKS